MAIIYRNAYAVGGQNGDAQVGAVDSIVLAVRGGSRFHIYGFRFDAGRRVDEFACNLVAVSIILNANSQPIRVVGRSALTGHTNPAGELDRADGYYCSCYDTDGMMRYAQHIFDAASVLSNPVQFQLSWFTS